MKIKRFIGRNMREAIRLVREEQGPDSVILSNRRVPGGIEVVAAVDYDEALMQASLRRPAEAAAPAPAPVVAAEPEVAAEPPRAPVPPHPLSKLPVDRLLAEFGEPEDRIAPAPRPAMAAAANQAASLVHAVSGNHAMAAACAPAATPSAEFQQLKNELGGMRRLIEEQLAGLAWNDLRRNKPQRYNVLKTLTDLGLDTALARDIAEQIPESTSEERARFLPLGLLARRIPVAREDLILDGGVIALVGPTGVGKTTTIAKLAARYAERHGLRDIALVAMDTYRIGAAEQLYTYGRLLGVPVYTVTPQQSLREMLTRLGDRRLVLIDTVGMSPRDVNLQQQIATLSEASPRLKVWLTIAATSQSHDQDEVIRRFGGVAGEGAGRLSACVLSKLDETTRIGGALSTAIRHRLPIAYVADGQRVPEDLQVARPDSLVIRAQQLARNTPQDLDDDTMALRFASSFDKSNPAAGVQAHV